MEATSLPAARREQRIRALGSLACSAVTVPLIFGFAAVMIMAEMGFNVTTIVAGTSMVAVTLAFGVQSLVKDLVSGVFMLVEDQLGVGDFVDMEKASGVVEAIGLRVTQLRDDNGTVWYVRNGEVVRVGQLQPGRRGRAPKDRRASPSPTAAVDLRRPDVSCAGSGPGAPHHWTAPRPSDRWCRPALGRPGSSTWRPAAAASNCSASIPGTTAVTVSLIPVMPCPGWKVTSALVSTRGRRVAAPGQAVGQRHREAGGVGGGDQLLRAGLAVGLLGARGPADLEGADAGRDERDLALALHQGALPVGFRGPDCGHDRTPRRRVWTDVDHPASGRCRQRPGSRRVRDNGGDVQFTRPQTFYDAVGGHETFVALVQRFYEGVAADPPLRALYPEEDLGPAEERLPDVPRAVLGRADHLQRAARPPAAADAARAVRGDARRCGTAG